MFIIETSFISVLVPWYLANCFSANQCARTLLEKTSHKCIWTKNVAACTATETIKSHHVTPPPKELCWPPWKQWLNLGNAIAKFKWMIGRVTIYFCNQVKVRICNRTTRNSMLLIETTLFWNMSKSLQKNVC